VLQPITHPQRALLPAIQAAAHIRAVELPHCPGQGARGGAALRPCLPLALQSWLHISGSPTVANPYRQRPRLPRIHQRALLLRRRRPLPAPLARPQILSKPSHQNITADIILPSLIENSAGQSSFRYELNDYRKEPSSCLQVKQV